jgi:uncharacterized protein (DUF169 family)
MSEKKEYSKADYRRAGEEIYHKLHLATYPIAIKYIKDINEIPRSAIRPSTMGRKKRQMSICQAFTVSRRMGVNVAITSEDNFCVPSSIMHGWERISKDDFIESQVRQRWHSSSEAEKRRTEFMLKKSNMESFESFQKLGYCGLICSPLPKIINIPDSILIYCDGAQLTHIIHSLCYDFIEDYIPITAFEGFGESCGKGALQPFITQKPQIVIPGMGDRSFAGISEHEVGIGLPSFLIFYVLSNLFKSGGMMNIGYPLKNLIPLHLTENLTPGFKFLREKINELKKNEENK